MLDRDIRQLSEDLHAFRSRVNNMVIESSRESAKHVAEDELPLEVPFHEGEAGAYEIVLSAINELSQQGSPISINAIEELYLNLLFDYKRMEGTATALQTALTEMQNLFELPSEEKLEEDEHLARKARDYGQNARGQSR